MPDTAYVSIFTDNDLTRITEDHFEIKLIARLLDQMYVVQPPVFPLRYDDTPPSAPQFPEHLHSLLTRSEAEGMIIWQQFNACKKACNNR